MNLHSSRSLFALLLALSVISASCSTPATKTASRATATATYPVTVSGGDEKSFVPNVSIADIVQDKRKYDVVIVGGGLAGLSAALYLSDHLKSVLLLEKEEHFGGLASGTRTESGARYDRGAAYWTDAYEEELEILKHIGLGNFKKKFPIHEPIDSYYWNGKMYLGIWEEETLEHLPASFALFKHELELANDDGLIPNQPFEEADKKDLDQMDAQQWIRSMPAKTRARTDKDSKEVLERFERELAEGKLDKSDPMKNVTELMDLYCRSALGGDARDVSAMAFANFYISEIETRFTTPSGTGKAAQNIVKRLRLRKGLVKLLNQAPVGKVTNGKDGVEVTYTHEGKVHHVAGNYAIFAAQLTMAPKLIQGFATEAPEQAKLMSGIDYAHYSVHAVEVKGHPFRATYDTWTRAADYTDDDFTDLILGRWMDKKINGYEGMRDFSKDPSDTRGVLSIYHPLGKKWVGKGYTDEQATQLARGAVERMIELYEPMLQKNWGTHIEVVSVETNRWPYSVHIAAPGYFTNQVKVLRKPFGRVFFAHSNLGTPAFEEALFRGHCAANNVLTRMSKTFKQEKWTQCPLEASN